MMRCPKCSATFGDDMSFCLNDGTSLVVDAPADLPETMFYQQPPEVTRTDPPAKVTAPFVPVHPTYQQSQFGQQPSFGVPQQRGGRFGVGTIVAGIAAFFAGLIILVIGVVAIFVYSRGKTTDYSYNSQPTNFGSSNSNLRNSTPSSNSQANSSGTYGQDTGQGETKNGFKQVAFEDATSLNFFPGANKTSAATYDDGTYRVVSFLSVYDTPALAKAAYESHLKGIKSVGKTITSTGDNYSYYSKPGSYSVAMYIQNKLYEFNATKQDVLYRFAK